MKLKLLHILAHEYFYNRLNFSSTCYIKYSFSLGIFYIHFDRYGDKLIKLKKL